MKEGYPEEMKRPEVLCLLHLSEGKMKET